MSVSARLGRVGIATAITMGLSLLGLVTPALAEGPWPAPQINCSFPEEPQMVDRQQSDQDQFIIKDLPCVSYYDGETGQSLASGLNSTQGHHWVFVHTRYVNEQDQIIDGPQYTLLFNQGGMELEAPNSYTLSTPICNPDTGMWNLNLIIGQAADSTMRWDTFGVRTHGTAWSPAVNYDMGERIMDGETRSIVLGNDTVHNISGLKPDDFTFKVYQFYPNNLVVPMATLKASLGRCGANVPPVTATPTAPRGALVQRSGRRMQATGYNTKVDYTAAFRVTIDPPRGVTVSRSFDVGAGKMGYHTYSQRPKGTNYTLKAKVKVRSPTGSLTWVWKKLASSSVR